MTEQPKPWKAEYARSSRATCKTCSNKIASNEFRIARVIPAVQFDGFMTVWHHANCLLKKPKQFKLLDEVEGVDNLRWEDQQVLQKYLEGDTSKQDGGKDDGESKPNADINDYAIENAKSSRATCKACNEKIGKGDVRVSKMESGSGRFRGKTPSWRHIKCFLKSGEWVNPLEEIPGWEELSRDDQKDMKAILKSMNKGSKQESASREEPSRTSKRIIKPDANKEETKSKKRQKKSTEDDENAKKKPKQSIDTGRLKSTGLEKGLEAQSKGLWAIKDNFSKHVSSAEMKEMLAANSQNDSGSEYDLRERCADGMMFGALEKCPMCGGHVEYHSGLYKCMGFMSAWSKCSFKSETHERSKTKWKVPEDTSNKYLLEWYKKQKLLKPARLLLPQRPTSKQTAETDADAPAGSFLKGLGICLIGKLGKSKANWQEIIEGAGGHLHAYPKSDTSCVIINEAELEKDNRNIQQAVALKVPVLKEEFLTACMDKRTKLSFSDYVVEAVTMLPATTKVKVKGRSSVHEDSGLQDTGHILEEGKVIYNTTLNLSDLSTGINSYYILQIIEDDHKKSHHIFRKWGRVGNASIGGQKIEKMSKNSAIAEFKRLFREKTGNDWEDWGKKDGFKKNPGKFFPLEIDYGVDEVGKSELVKAGSKSKLDQRLVELLKMLFDIETYRAAMMEFEINMSEMPLGKLSKGNIEQGFHVLTEIQSILATDEPVAALLMDASNRFFTIIPSIHPIIIRDEKNLKTKIEMLEALRDIEIASHFMNLTNEEAEEDPIDVNYKKLHCELSPLPRDGVEYQLIGKYLQRTHAPTHKEWSLHLEDVYVVDRNGESAAFAPFKESLENHMLLWHGSRTTNYVGILSQGLRIAPPEAPVTGYMFGKGIYFADLVSKSAQYCYTTKSSPIGLMLLSEVALGEMKEFTTAKYMEKPPSGFDSTKGLGQMKPKESEYETLENDVVVPCGVPVPSGVKGTSLLYNEYIVYNQSQAKLRYLLKVRFQHKR